ncbi:MAG TPA: N-methyl-L-tryptophan oxidase [Hyphomicrobiaceae bacterium]|nr:N-methyl-L-tryptophan oxidase [Hyphomicrobiaceae bacterium]
MSKVFDTIVVGIGGMGSATLYQLAKRGQRVLGIERFDLGHVMGSSHGHTRIIRIAYYEGSEYVPIVKRAHELWREVGTEADMQLLHVTGALDLAPIGQGFVESSLQSCLDHGLEHEVLDAKEIMRRYPAFRLPKTHHALFQKDGGFVLSEKAIFAHSGLALKHGAELHVGEVVRDFRPTADGGVEVRTDRDVYTAGKLVLSAGAWIREFAPDALRSVTTVKQAIGWFQTRAPEKFALGALPVFILTVEEGNFYGFPVFEHPGFKIGGPHLAREPIDPNSPDRTPSPRQVAAIQDCLAKYLPDAGGPPLTLKGCMYTVTPDEHFILDALPGLPQVLVASPCSGHGFKFASAIGEIMADLAVEGRARFDLSPFSIGRQAVASS